MNLSERRRQFEAVSKADPLATKKTKIHKLFGVSNSAKVIGRGLQLGVVNLDNVTEEADGFAFECTMSFPPADEVYFTAYVKSGTPQMIARLAEMKRVASASPAVASRPAEVGAEEEDGEDSSGNSGFSLKNNNVVIVLAADGSLRLRNKGFWDEMPEDLNQCGAAIAVDKVNVALYPPAASARRSLLAREFVGFLGSLIGREKVHELNFWKDPAAVSAAMQRMPATIPVSDIEQAVQALGGHYPGGEVRRFHAAMNFLSNKHFIILMGLSGTGKTRLAIAYAKAVHGVGVDALDPFLFVCPVRPEWTDPSGLTGYYDVLSNRYMVPPFLEAVLVATAHRDSPVFVVLDELNLARVEHYLSDVLSSIETGEAIQLHSHGVPLEGSTGTPIPAALPLPPNLYIVGTINIDETTNPVSDKVLDRAFLIDMSLVDLPGFLASLQAREPRLAAARAACEGHLLEVHKLMTAHGLGFGYRVAEEAVRYYAFVAAHIVADTANAMDDVAVQKILVKLRGSERQRALLTDLGKLLVGLPRSRALIARLLGDLDEFGTFQVSR